MKLVLETNQEIKLKSAVKPTFRNKRGRTWDAKTCIIEGKETYLNYDSTWGRRFYVCINDKWYSGDVFDLDLVGYRANVKVMK